MMRSIFDRRRVLAQKRDKSLQKKVISMHAIISFVADERGAIAINWVVLTSSALAMALAAVFLMGGGVETSAQRTGDTVAAYSIDDDFDRAPGTASGPLAE
jgi:hypothetical protein